MHVVQGHPCYKMHRCFTPILNAAQELSDSEVIIHVIRDRCRPAFPAGCPACFRQLAERCWDELPESRPSMQEVEEQLTAVQVRRVAAVWLLQGRRMPVLASPTGRQWCQKYRNSRNAPPCINALQKRCCSSRCPCRAVHAGGAVRRSGAGAVAHRGGHSARQATHPPTTAA